MRWLLPLLFACHRDEPPPAPSFMFVKGATWDDAREVEKVMSPAAPYLHKSAQLMTDEGNWMTMVVGTTPDYFPLRNVPLGSGRLFTDADGGNVVVIGDKLVEMIHAQLGATVRIDGKGFEVIGVLAHQGVSETGQDLDDQALVPVDVFDKKLRGGSRKFDGALLVGNPARIDELRELLHTRHRGVDDFTIRALPVQ